VTTIGSEAFDSTLLTSITIPDLVTIIGGGAFFEAQLTSITIPDSIEEIEGYAFYNCPIQTIKINCCTEEENNIKTTLDNILAGNLQTGNLETLKIALSSSLVEKESQADNLLEYVRGILRLSSSVISDAIFENSGLFELDLSNTTITPTDINNMTRIQPWTVIFYTGERRTYDVNK
jgi:hypothetical protein